MYLRLCVLLFLFGLCFGYNPLTSTFNATYVSILITAECGSGTGAPSGFCGSGPSNTCQITTASVQSANVHSGAYQSVTVPLVQYGSNSTCCYLEVVWYPSSSNSIVIDIEDDGICAYMAGSVEVENINSLPASAKKSSYPLTFIVYQVTDCPSDSTWCGTSCCTKGTICTSPTTGECCAVQEYQCSDSSLFLDTEHQ